MPSGKPLAPDVNDKIFKVFREHPKWKAPKIRNEVNRLLQGLDSDIPNSVPSLSYVRQKLTKMRNALKSATADPQDQIWSLAALDNYPIPPEALLTVMKIWKYRKYGLTIREVKWIARLLTLLPAFVNKVELIGAACGYAVRERDYEGMGEVFDSYALDLYWFSSGTNYAIERLKHLTESIASKTTIYNSSADPIEEIDFGLGFSHFPTEKQAAAARAQLRKKGVIK